MQLQDITCIECGAPELHAVAPGTEPATALELFCVNHGIPLRAYCPACWRRRWGVGNPSPYGTRDAKQT